MNKNTVPVNNDKRYFLAWMHYKINKKIERNIHVIQTTKREELRVVARDRNLMLRNHLVRIERKLKEFIGE